MKGDKFEFLHLKPRRSLWIKARERGGGRKKEREKAIDLDTVYQNDITYSNLLLIENSWSQDYVVLI